MSFMNSIGIAILINWWICGAAFADVAQSQPVANGEVQKAAPEWKPPETMPTFSVGVDCWVSQISTAKAGLGGEITVTVVNPDAYIQWAREQNKELASSRTVPKLVIFLDGQPMAESYPFRMNPYQTEASITVNGPTYTMLAYELTFQLIRTTKNNAAWAELLNRPNSSGREVTVSVGFEDLKPVASNIQKTSDNPAMAHFELVVVPFDAWVIGGILLIAASVGIFMKLAGSTELLRDPQAPLKPDKCRPFSLARTQMAFWFFLVFSTYFLIWAITGDKDTIPGSVLGLIGISAATAISSSVVDSGRAYSDQTAQDAWLVTLTGSRREKLARAKKEEIYLASEVTKADDDVKAFKKNLGATPGKTLDELQKTLGEMQAAFGRAQGAVRYFSRDPWQVFAYDILSDQDIISFSRFQIIVWTLLLGIIFLKEVYMHLAMPEFSPYLLGLMGISAGTFVGLKTTTKPGS